MKKKVMTELDLVSELSVLFVLVTHKELNTWDVAVVLIPCSWVEDVIFSEYIFIVTIFLISSRI